MCKIISQKKAKDKPKNKPKPKPKPKPKTKKHHKIQIKIQKIQKSKTLHIEKSKIKNSYTRYTSENPKIQNPKTPQHNDRKLNLKTQTVHERLLPYTTKS